MIFVWFTQTQKERNKRIKNEEEINHKNEWMKEMDERIGGTNEELE